MSGMEESQAVRRINAICYGSALKHLPTGKRYYIALGQVNGEFELIPISGPSVYITRKQLHDSDAWERQ